MKVDVAQVLTELDGRTPITIPSAVCEQCGAAVEGQVLTLRKVCVDALLHESVNRSEKPELKVQRYQVALLINQADGEVTLTAEQVADTKKCVGSVFAPIVVGQAWPMLEGDDV